MLRVVLPQGSAWFCRTVARGSAVTTCVDLPLGPGGMWTWMPGRSLARRSPFFGADLGTIALGKGPAEGPEGQTKVSHLR